MTKLKEGEKAPRFTGIDQNGKSISLSDFSGKPLILFFYPKDMTPGCTAEACNLRDNYSELKKQGFEILGVSPDNISRHQKFIEKYELPFPLIADGENETIPIRNANGIFKTGLASFQSLPPLISFVFSLFFVFQAVCVCV